MLIQPLLRLSLSVCGEEMKKITAHEIALSALSCAITVLCLTIGVYSEILLFTGYLLSSIVMMMPLAKRSFRGYLLAYLASCILSTLFSIARFWEILPFILFFGLHPLVNELQLKSKINRWLACALKALWFDGAMILIWWLIFKMSAPIAGLEKFMIPLILVLGTAFFIVYDYLMYRWRALVNSLVARISKK